MLFSETLRNVSTPEEPGNGFIMAADESSFRQRVYEDVVYRRKLTCVLLKVAKRASHEVCYDKDYGSSLLQNLGGISKASQWSKLIEYSCV